jgi:hypothetical protein
MTNRIQGLQRMRRPTCSVIQRLIFGYRSLSLCAIQSANSGSEPASFPHARCRQPDSAVLHFPLSFATDFFSTSAGFVLAQRPSAALRAISPRCSGVSLAARAASAFLAISVRSASVSFENPFGTGVPERKHLEALLSFARATVTAAYSGELAERYGRALERIVRMERPREHPSADIDSFRRAKAIAQSALLKTEVAG